MNSSIKKILVPIDLTEFSEAAISNAVSMAKLLNAEVFLIHVLAVNDYYFSIVPEMRTLLPSITEIEVSVKKRMEELQANVTKQSGITPNVFVTTGNIETEIIDFSKKKKIDLILMGTHGASGYKELFIGSNAQRVVSLSDIPVLTMQNGIQKPEFKNILLPIDNSLHSREKLNIVMVIANLFGAIIHLLGLPDSDKKEDLDKFNIKMKSIGEIITAEKLSFKASIVDGDNIAKAALAYAKENKCDLIAVNTGHESKITGIFPGLFAQQIVNHSTIPVLSIKHTEGHYDITTPGFGIG